MKAVVAFGLWLLGSVASAQGRWERLEDAAMPPAVLELKERWAGGHLRARDEVLERTRRGQVTRLNPVGTDGTGEILHLAADPGGVVFVVRTDGLFVVSPSVDVLDRVIPGPGFPEGSIIGAAVDTRRRLWLLTEKSFACVDPAWFRGTTFPEGDGLPPPPYRELRLGSNGRVLVRSDAGVFAYTPDDTKVPSVRIRSVDGEPHTGKRVTTTWPGKLRLEVEGSPGTKLYYYRDGHHVLRALDGGKLELSDFPPGSRTVSVVAIDRDLNRSPPAVLAVDARYPKILEPRSVILIGVAVVGLLLGALSFRARRQGGGLARYAKAGLNTALVTVCGLQILAGCFPHSRGWPFVGFSMYTESHQLGDVISLVTIRGLTEGGAPWIRSGQFGVSTDSDWQIIRPFVHADTAARREFLERYHQQPRSKRLQALQVIAYRHRLTKDGPVSVSDLILAHYETGQ